jgi:hypothetical protein
MEEKNEERNEEQNEEKSYEKSSTMRFRSTGLGKTMLFGHVDDIFTMDGALIVSVKTDGPVLWHIRVGSNLKGAWNIIGKALKLQNILFLLGLKKRNWPEEF